MKGYPLLRQLCLTLSVCPLKSCFTVTVGCSVICTLGELGVYLSVSSLVLSSVSPFPYQFLNNLSENRYF